MNYKILKLAVENNIGVITISRPEALNALNTNFFKEMDSLLDDIEGNSVTKLKNRAMNFQYSVKAFSIKLKNCQNL